jgi:hypothetical protein
MQTTLTNHAANDVPPPHSSVGNIPPTVEALRNRPDAGRPVGLVASIEPLLVDTDQAAALCSISPAGWYRLKAARKTPLPVRLGGKVLYSVADLKLWVALRCPPWAEFEARRAAQAGGRSR